MKIALARNCIKYRIIYKSSDDFVFVGKAFLLKLLLFLLLLMVLSCDEILNL